LVVVNAVPPPNANDVPVATPITGVINVGVLAYTATPVPVSSVNVVDNSPEVTLATFVPYNVPLVGMVTLVADVVVRVRSFAGVVVKFPPTVINLPVFATPVPPYSPVRTLPCHTPVPMVPKLVIFPCTAVGSVELIEGTPPALVINTPSLPVVIDDNVFAADV
jgi:hypothetical protein